MIRFDFEYHRPETVRQAADVFRELSAAGKSPLYYGGGTEIVTSARLGQSEPGAVVDLKDIPELGVLEMDDGELTIGAARTLADLSEADPWPFLSAAAGRVADHTARCRITLGGNIAGQIQYREAALPLMLAHAHAVLAGPKGQREVPFQEIFDGTLQIGEDEFIAQLKVPRDELDLPFFSRKRTRLDWVDYPLVTVCAVRGEDGLQVAISGYCNAPFHSRALDRALAEDGPAADRVRRALRHVPSPVVSDVHGSAGYRELVLTTTLVDMLQELGR